MTSLEDIPGDELIDCLSDRAYRYAEISCEPNFARHRIATAQPTRIDAMH
jgi:hypothetical protein